MSEQTQPQLSAHDAAMVAKMDANTASAQALIDTAEGKQPAAAAPAAEAPKRPDNVPEKFWDAEKGQVNTDALLKSYTELESSKPQPGAKPEGEADPAAAAAAAAKLDLTQLDKEYAETGALSDASYEALAATGITRDMVDGYIAGQVAIAQQRDAAGFALVGGKEQYGAMVQWAKGNLSAAELAAFDQGVTGTDVQMKQAILSLKSQFEAASGSEPNLLGGNPAAASGGALPFASRAEVTAAMRDPRYRVDPAYRAVVEQRIGLMENF